MKIVVPVCLSLLFIATASAAQAPAAARIPIFIRSAGTVGGFTDPSKARQDSARDLREKIDHRVFVWAKTEAEAVLVVEVLDRGQKQETSGFWGQRDLKRLTVRLTAGEFSSELTGEARTSNIWMDVAGQTMNQIAKWATANRARLLAAKETAQRN